MKRDHLALPYEYLTEMEELDDAEFGMLVRALLRYSMDGTTIPKDGNLRFFSARVMAREDRYQETYNDVVEKRSASGRRGAESRWKSREPSQTQTNSKRITGDGKNGKRISDDGKNGKRITGDGENGERITGDGENVERILPLSGIHIPMSLYEKQPQEVARSGTNKANLTWNKEIEDWIEKSG